jgi:GR25 family glycosyltransferase involved in LPS biosynthesis
MKRVFADSPIYWINLKTSIERRKNMEKQLKNLNHKRIRAINGINSYNFQNNYNITNINPNFSDPLTAVMCSHVKAIYKAHKNNLQFVIILEDKCQFDLIEYFKHTIKNIIDLANKKDPNWELIQLSSIPLYDLNDYKKNGLQVHSHELSKYFGSNYLINRRGMNTILNKIPTNGKNIFNFENIKNQSCPEEMIFGNLNCLIINFPLLYVYANTSTFKHYFKSNNDDDQKKVFYNGIHIETKNDLVNFINENKNLFR